MSVSVLVSATALATACAAVSAAVVRRPRRAEVADGLRGPLGVSEADIVRDLAASFETREG